MEKEFLENKLNLKSFYGVIWFLNGGGGAIISHYLCNIHIFLVVRFYQEKSVNITKTSGIKINSIWLNVIFFYESKNKFSLHLYIYFACLSICLNPKNVKMAKLIRPNFFMATYMTLRKVYVPSKFNNFAQNVEISHIWKCANLNIKIRENLRKNKNATFRATD